MTTAALAEPVVLTDARMAAVTAGQLDLTYPPGLTNVIPTDPYSPHAVRAAGRSLTKEGLHLTAAVTTPCLVSDAYRLVVAVTLDL